ncbi:MAG: hypothetical protein JNL32_16500, partial [Candidatus Kapabacteria bacterium]|nr:hypothetical protein [Candidatus Kapabacteria bacterium]
LYNSVLIGYPRGIEIANANTMAAANNDSSHVRYNSWFGIKGTWLNFAGGTPPSGMTTAWVANANFQNSRSSTSDVQLINPFATNNSIDPTPLQTSPVINTASFARQGIVPIDNPYFTIVPYRGAFAPGERWDLPWAEYDPVNREYRAVSPIRLLTPAGGEKYLVGQSVDVKWDTARTSGLTLKLQFATSKTGPWNDIAGLTAIQDAGATRGTVKWTVPATVTKTGYLRLVNVNNENQVSVNDAPFEIIEPPKPVARLLSPGGTAGETYRPGTSVDIRWDTTATFRQRWKFQFGQSATGPWTDLAGATSVIDSAARRGVFVGGFRVPAIRTTSGYLRMVNLADTSLNDVCDNPFTIVQPEASRADSVLRTPVTGRVQLSNTKIYSVDGYVFVDNGGV